MTALLALLLTAAPDAGAEPSSAELIRAAEEAVLAEPPPTGAPAALDPWDFQTPPKYFELVTGRFQLNEGERALLFKNGFVVASRFRQDSYHEAFHELHTSQLPLFVSTDAVLHAVFRSHDAFLIDIEREVLAPKLVEALRAMHAALPAARKLWPKEVAADVDFYLRLARLIAVDEGLTATPTEAAWLSKVTRARAAETVTLFGRARRVDFTQFQPRGHYSDSRNELQAYFRLVMWLSRVELNLKSNACASSHPGPLVLTAETPREVLVALALAELAERSGTTAAWAHLDQVFGAIAGRREDVSFSQLASLRAEAHVASLTEPDAAERVIAAIGERYQRTVNLHLMPPNQVVRPLPVIATVLGPRITPDAEALGPLTFELDPVAWAAVLGHPRALDYVQKTADSTPEDRARTEDAARRLAAARFGDDLFSTWLRALLAHARPPPGVQSAFTTRPAWADFRVDTALVGYAQLRHNNVLYAAQVEGEGGCRIPDAYVEPNVETYEALVDFAKAGRAAVAALDGLGAASARRTAYFERLERVLRVLAAVSRQELANRPLSADAQRFLAMVVETWAVRSMYGILSVAQRDGWYFDLLYRLDHDRGNLISGHSTGAVFAPAEFIADLHGQPRKVAYAGARAPELGFFVVDAAGAPRLMVGPVARGFALWAPRQGRLTDDDVAADVDQRRFTAAPWAASYRAPSGLRRLSLYPSSEWAWEVYDLVPTGQPFMGAGGGVERDQVPVKKPVTVRLLGEHGEQLLSAPLGKGGTFTVPAELRKTARRITAETADEVVERPLARLREK